MQKHDRHDTAFPDFTETKQTEDINHLFELSSSLVCIAGFDGYFKQLSPAWATMLGFSSDDLLTTPFLEFVHPDDVKATIAEVKRLLAENHETVSFINRYRCKDGGYKWLQWNVTPEKSNSLMYCVANDITEMKKNQTKLEIINDRLSKKVKVLNCLYKLSEILSSRDMATQSVCRLIIEEMIIAYKTPESICGRINLHTTYFHTENFNETKWQQKVAVISDGNEVGTIEIYSLKALPEEELNPFLINETNMIDTIAKMIGDFYKRTAAVSSLTKSEEKHRLFAEHTEDGFFVIQNGKIMYSNELFEKMIGLHETGGITGTDISSIFLTEERETFLKMCSEIEEGRLKRKHFRGEIVTKGEQYLWVDGHFSFVEWAGEGSIIGTLRNIDDDMRHKERIRNEANILRRENLKLKSTFKDRFKFGTIIGKSQAMQEIYEQITEAGSTDASVVILGETGTGKEEVARNIHNNSLRVQNGFAPINCGAIPSSLFESELFGYKKGAFSGAFVDKHGFLDLAHQGTFFLDEVGELDLNMQVKLLRVLETGEYIPVGCNTVRHSDVRIISATNANLETLVEEKKMREDFYYRINVIPICLPPLRERKEDIPLLADFFLKKYIGRGCDITFSGKEIDLLCDHSWPGNIRELQNVVQRYIGAKNLYFFKTESQNKESQQKTTQAEHDCIDFRAAMRFYEKKIITEALEENYWHKEKTAAMLGLPKRTFFRKLNSIGLKKA